MIPSLWHHMSYRKAILTIWQNMNARGQKSQFTNFLVNWGSLEVQSRLIKNPNFPSLLWTGKNKYAQPKSNISKSKIWIYGWIGKSYDNVSFSVENKMENAHKKGWLYFKLNINDWSIPFPKILRIYLWIGKHIFHWGKWSGLIGNSACSTEYLAKRPWRYSFLAYVYKSIALVNKLKRLKC